MKEKYLSIILICCLLLCACGNKQEKYQEQYDLGIKYLSDGNYEEAVIAFEAAIKIDAKQSAAYIGRGDSYMGLAEQTSDAAQKEAYYSQAAADYRKAKELGDDESERRLQQTQLLMNSQEMLQAIYQGCAAEDIESLKILMQQDGYQELVNSIDEGYLFYGGDNGYGLAIYPNNFCYFGQWKNGLRNGQGFWVRALFNEEDTRISYFYKGAWSNDVPNGEGQIQIERKENDSDDTTTSILTEINGTFVDGYEDGMIQIIYHLSDGNVIHWTPITAIHGVYQPLADEYQRTRPVMMEEGSFVVAIGQHGNVSSTLWWSEDGVECVLGLED